MKQIITIAITLLLLTTSTTYRVNAETPAPPNVSGDGIVLMDATTGEILYGKNIDATFPPASTTKIMTALLTLENCKLDDVVTVSNDFTTRNFKSLDGNKIYIQDGEQITVKDLLYALLLPSANDAAVALAEHISGSIPEFAKLMNERAKELGCTTANFQNPNGLYDNDHRVSAKDLALILRQLATHPEFSQIATTPRYTMAPTNKFDPVKTKFDRTLINEDKLVYKNLPSYYYEGIEGGKTGYTIQSLHSYVASATRDNHRLIVTILHSNDRTFFQDARNLFDYGFKNFDLKKLYSKGDIVTTFNESDGNKISLLASKDFYYVNDKTSNTVPAFNFNEASLKDKYFHKGDVVSNLDMKLNGKDIGTLALVSSADYNPNVNSIAKASENNLKNNRVAYGIGIVIILLLLNTYRLKRISAAKKRRYLKYRGLK
ncbi:D-alanyl-D-alanine carboxypeptidase family protein [Clostridium pasteurianum]|uniref:serine-type D-Ala-D-Ala carboxypeptidase n=1 Tax=Clostridium pasteurianum BC1 TaxID=86416 RepID=R4KBR7_CLOPA|nr:D-alanyl-D-alanine carboxypeptidase family protein [Clostridium pasteurianum]AGK97055.1 D-alanyl-D-alanine carboxypeptidase [Clostridium pasteurianum BC1]